MKGFIYINISDVLGFKLWPIMYFAFMSTILCESVWGFFFPSYFDLTLIILKMDLYDGTASKPKRCSCASLCSGGRGKGTGSIAAACRTQARQHRRPHSSAYWQCPFRCVFDLLLPHSLVLSLCLIHLKCCHCALSRQGGDAEGHTHCVQGDAAYLDSRISGPSPGSHGESGCCAC